MIWHVIAHIGNDINHHDPHISSSQPQIHVALERPTDRRSITNNVIGEIEKISGGFLKTQALDLLNLAMVVYSADLRVPRKYSVDRWARSFIVHFPVQNLVLWQKTSKHIEQVLNFLTGDKWQFEFRQKKQIAEQQILLRSPSIHTVCLFSGGLDSLVGAIDLLAQGKSVALVGHHGSGLTNPVQERVLKAVIEKYKEKVLPFMCYVEPPKKNVGNERTMRSRSFLFFSIGIAVLSALNSNEPLIIAENGLISLNIPLTLARTGSRSTRTTHPHYVAMFQELTSELGIRNRLELPYYFKTKGEMLQESKDQNFLEKVAKLTMSCSHPEMGRFRYSNSKDHCGHCVPCIIRRSAMYAASMEDAPYHVDLQVEPPSHTTDTGSDYRAFQMAIARAQGMSESRAAFTVLRSGPIAPDQVENFARLYLRGLREVQNFIDS